jgi:hypothetical protein
MAHVSYSPEGGYPASFMHQNGRHSPTSLIAILFGQVAFAPDEPVSCAKRWAAISPLTGDIDIGRIVALHHCANEGTTDGDGYGEVVQRD